MSELAFISGATAGIGRAIAHKLAAADYRLIITGRRTDRLQQLAQNLHAQYGVAVLPLRFDVQDAEACSKAIGSLPEDWRSIDVLVNNAGLSQGLNPVHEGDWADWDRMLDTNVKGLLRLSQLICRGMIARNKGHILMVSSIAGKEVYANGNVYCASKHAVEAITKSMRLELNPYGIRVSSIAPGLVETEFSEVRFKGDLARAAQVGMVPFLLGDAVKALIAALIVSGGWAALSARRS